MSRNTSRRAFLKDMGLKASALPFLLNLPGLGFANTAKPKQRLVVVFSPNGIVPKNFWPDEAGSFTGEKAIALKEILKPLDPFKDKLLTLHGVCDKVRGDGDNHMRGMGCLLTGIELFPGNIQGGSDTPAGWASGISIDQEIKNFLAKDPATRTRFGSLEYGVLVPKRADTWTRMVYSGPNKPISPVDDPYQMFAKLYGKSRDREMLGSILDTVRDDLAKVEKTVGSEDRKLLQDHQAFVREMEQEIRDSRTTAQNHPVPLLEPGIREDNDNIPKLAKMQIELMVAAFKADFNRIATFQITNSVGMPRMKWLGINEGHHELSHEPNSNEPAQEKLTKINKWYAEQVAHLAKRLAETPEPGASGSMLDHTTIVWTNELGQGNSHTLDNIPFILVGGGLGYKTGKAMKFPKVPHNRLLLSLAHSFGHRIDKFGNPDHCTKGVLSLT